MNQQEALLLEDEKSRLRALELDSFIVEAPAGAGKTELLTQRYLRLLQTVQAPEEIIAITFTNKAASEMRSRIMDSLQMAAAGVMPEQPHKLVTFDLGLQALQRSAELYWNLLESPARLRIYTIDSLCSNLARQMPLLSRFGTQPAVSDDAAEYYRQAATRALETLEDPEFGAVVQDALRYFDNDTYRLTQLLADMLARRDQWLPYTQANNTAQAAEAALAHLVQEDIRTAAKILPVGTQQVLMPIARFAAGNLPCDHPVALLLDWETPLQVRPEALPMWQAVASLLLTADGQPRKEGGLNAKIGFPATDAGRAQKKALAELLASLADFSALHRVRSLPDPAHDEEAWQMVATLARLLHIAVGELWLVFQAHNEVDFVEVSQRALRALGSAGEEVTELALKLDYHIQHLLVDEFQDTSPMQISLIEALTCGWAAGDGRTLFAVGDPMQSIYRFRKANVGLFLRVEKHGIGDIRLIPLKLWRNNRSDPSVVGWVNRAFERVFPKQDSISRGAICYRPFVATRQEEAGAGVFVHPMLDEATPAEAHDENGEPVATSNVRQLEAERVIHIIEQTWQEDTGRKIAVLVRARSHLHALVMEIRRNHPALSFQAVEIEELANRQIVQDLLSLTHALHHRADRVHWLAVLRAPWCGLTLVDLHKLINGDRDSTVMHLMRDEARLQGLSDDGRGRLLHVRHVMEEALLHYGRMPTSRWVHGVWLMLGGADCLWDAGDVRDVQAFFERIDALENAGRFSPEQLSLEVQKLYAAPDALAPDRLQFMTIHKSKGLEFDTVILPGLDCRTGGGEQSLLLWEEVSREAAHDGSGVDLVVAPLIPGGRKPVEAAPYDYLKLLESERAAYEDARVLYVAATRAKRCLHLLGAAGVDGRSGEPKPPGNTFLEMLWPVVQEEFVPDKLVKGKAGASLNTAGNIQDFIPQLVRLEKPETPPELSAVTGTGEAAATYAAMEAVAGNFDAVVGTLAHLYLQLIAESDLSAWAEHRIHLLKPAMQRWFAQQGCTTGEAKRGADRVAALLNDTLRSEAGQWVLQARESASSEFALEIADAQAARKQVVDRTFVEEGMRWIIDYKTASLPGDISSAGLASLAEQYRPQLQGYAALFAQDGLPVRMAVFFLSIAKLVVLP